MVSVGLCLTYANPSQLPYCFSPTALYRFRSAQHQPTSFRPASNCMVFFLNIDRTLHEYIAIRTIFSHSVKIQHVISNTSKHTFFFYLFQILILRCDLLPSQCHILHTRLHICTCPHSSTKTSRAVPHSAHYSTLPHTKPNSKTCNYV